jgi:hypothetical protein
MRLALPPAKRAAIVGEEEAEAHAGEGTEPVRTVKEKLRECVAGR